MRIIYKSLFLSACFMLFLSYTIEAQVNIGSLDAPVSAGLLQIKEIDPTSPFVDNQTATTGGFALPRVKLEERTSLAPLLTATEIAAADYATQKQLHTGTIVYNTITDPIKNLFVGIYLWDGEQWMMQKTQPPADFGLAVDVSIMHFPSGLTPEPIVAQPANISWAPASGICLASNDPLLNGGVDYTPPLQLGSNPNPLSVLPNPMTHAEIENDPFREKASTVNFTLLESGASETKKITLRQTHYSIQILNWEVGATINEAELGKEYTVRFLTNADWGVEIDNPSMFNFGMYPQLGTADITTGIEYRFRLNNNDLYEGQTAKLTFKSQANGKCNDVVVNIVATREYPNTYIVTPGTSFSFPVKKAYKAWEEDWELKKTALPGGVLGAVLIWQDAQNLIKASPGVTISGTGRNAIINVQTTAGIEGNAVIALTIGGVIYWSWQLWVTDYNPETALENVFLPAASENIDVSGGKVYSYFNSKRTTVLMDRNLGATTSALDLMTTIGNMYYWGRKDPFPCASIYNVNPGANLIVDFRPLYRINNIRITDFTNVGNTTIVGSTLKLAIQNPTRGYSGAAAGNDADWYSSTAGEHRNDLWIRPDGGKTIFDPCPKGWRVPTTGSGTQSLVYGLPVQTTPIGNAAGLDYTSSGFGILPASGRFDTPTGQQAYFFSGSTIWLWTASPAGGHSSYIAASSGGNPFSSSYERQFGYPVRCVRDESGN